MSESIRLDPPTTPLSRPAKIAWTTLISATLFICYFSHLGAIGFVGPDEPRYAWIARAMTETGDWVTPRLYGKPWFEKPPLFYWGAALSFKLFGVSEAAARLPSAICALLATLAMAWLAWRLYGAETARWLLLLLPTSVGMIGFSHAAATDMPFSAMLTIAMVCAAAVLRLTPAKTASAGSVLAEPPSASSTAAPPSPLSMSQPRAKPWLALVLFGFFLGLAVLAKGPAALILSGGAIFFWALFTKRWRDALRLLHPAAIVAFCLTALPWYILCSRRNPDFLRIFIIEHNFKRYLTPEFQHIQPFWFYVPIVLAALLPWAFLFLWNVISGAISLYHTRQMCEADWFLVCWPLFTILFFTVSKSKLPGYILPALPPIALLTAEGVKNRIGQPTLARWFFSLAGLTLILSGVLAIYFGEYTPFVTDTLPGPIVVYALVAALGGALATLLAFFRRLALSGMAATSAVVAIMAVGPGPSLDGGVSARPTVVGVLQRFTVEQAPTATTFKLRRAYKYQVDFYLHRETPEWSPQLTQNSIVFTDHISSAELIRLGGRCPHAVAFPAVWVCEYPSNQRK